MTVLDNLELGAVIRKDKAGIRRTLEEVMTLFPTLSRKRADRAGQLSGGEQQMVAVGRAMMSEPRLMMMDEPSAGLSPKVAEEMVTAIAALNRGGLSILLVEQMASYALQVTSRTYVMENGRTMFSGPSRELAHDDRVLDAYLGRHRSD